MTLRYWFVLLSAFFAVALCLAPVTAQEANGFCILQGTVKFTDGTPCKGVAVQIKVNGKDLNPPLTTDENGTFNRVAPAGEAVITVSGISKNATLIAGEQKSVAFEIKQTGVVVTLAYPDKTVPNNINLTVAVKAPELTNRERYNPQQVAPGRFWINNVPANATSLSIIANIYQNDVLITKRQIWVFDKVEGLRTLTMTLNKPSQVFVILLDANGQPMAESPVKGYISYNATNLPSWEGEDDANRYINKRRSVLNGKKTDGTGMIDLGEWPAQKYELSLRTDTLGGSPITFEPKADGTPLIVKYTLNLQPRDLSQIIFDSNAKPVPHAAVTVSYYWQGKVGYQQATADATGKVMWKGLPPVRAIVWGNSVAPCVIPVDATNVTTPLPAPTTDNNRTQQIRYNLSNLGDKPMRIIVVNRNRYYDNNNREIAFNPASDNPQQIVANDASVSGGSIINFFAISKSSPPRFAALSNFYMPYLEEGDRAEITVPMQEGTMLRGRFTTKTGPVTGLNQFRIVPVKVDNDISLGIDDESKRRMNLGYPQENADGAFTVALPGAGVYRLIVDLYDESTIPLPELVVDVPAAGKDIVVTLPEPLCTVLPGTEFCWTTKNAPAAVRRLVATARNNPMPMYGPKDQVLVYWYHPSPDKLTVWNGTGQAQTLPLRAAFLNLQNKEGQSLPGNSTMSMLPLLPSTNAPMQYYRYGYTDPQATRANTDTAATYFTGDRAYLPAVWAGKYLLMSANGNTPMNSRLIPVDISANVPAEISSRIDNSPIVERAPRFVHFKYSHGDIEQLRRSASEYIIPIFDTLTAPVNRQYLSSWNLTDGNTEAPADAKTVTLQWLGVGIMKDLPLPTAANATLDLPAWSPGATVTGKILSPDGTPYANKQLSIGTRLSDYPTTLRLTTDAQGGFTVKGLLPGHLFIVTDNDNNGGWTLAVPENGLSGLTLRVSANPIRINNISFNSGDNNAQAWWYPDGGSPTRLPVRYSSLCLHEAILGSGWIWLTDGYSGDGRYQRFTMAPGEQQLSERGTTAATGPTLGISFPLDLTKGLPGAVTLVGLEERSHIRVSYMYMAWQPSTILNKVVAQISAVPPGKYRVIVDTPFGMVETTTEVTQYGAAVELAFPAAAPAKPATPAAPAANGPAQFGFAQNGIKDR
ncbi:MAG TPA: carboxypeptidase-like regulatory domain-containing protein [Armatimonadota bacterium]|jgi:hypothetical protein